MIILDTSGLLAALDTSAPQHRAARSVLESAVGPLVVSPFMLAELDDLVAQRLGSQAMAPVLEDVATGAYELATIDYDDVASAALVADRYADQQIGLTDASLVVIAARYRTTRILTLDERHFRVIRPLWGEAFSLLPADAIGDS